jgi:WD40 repeat protein
MNVRYLLVAGLLGFTTAARAEEAKPVIAPGQKEPILRVQAGGPTSYVRALAASPDGKTFYVGGYDKVVRVYTLGNGGEFALERMTYRVPIAPGLDGAINAVAVSPDGTWLAAAGMGVVRESAGYRRPGLVVFREGRMTPEMWRDQGTIWLFNTKTHTVRPLRGHAGPVLALSFAPSLKEKAPLLISAAQEWSNKEKKFLGAVRVWDVTQTENPQVKSWIGIDLPAHYTSPGLAAWHTGQGTSQLQVAIAWGDGSLRIWDLEHDQEGITKMEDGRYNNTVAYAPNLKQLVTCSNRKIQGDGIVKVWSTEQNVDPTGLGRFPFSNGAAAFPRGLTLFASREGGPLDHAAVVLRMGEKHPEYRLGIARLGDESPEILDTQIPLWEGGDALPALAASRRGRYLAVAGNADHEVLVFAIDDLLQGRNQPQRLRSIGSTINAVAFARKDKDVGLLLRENHSQGRGKTPAEFAEGDLVMDFNHRTLTGDATGWKVEAPNLGGWRAVLEPRDPQTLKFAVTIFHGERQAGRVELKAGYEVTAFALLPPQNPAKLPILALAFLDDKVQPWLSLYQAQTGDQFRQLTGHTDPIRALAFSADGKLLASAAEDQTVSVWTMTNVDKTLGVRGMLVGVAFRPADNVVAVTHIDPDSPARGRLRLNDVIEGIVDQGQLRPIGSPREFYDEMTLRKPGSEVTLRIRGNNNVRLRLGQAVDERKPLFTLFTTRPGRDGGREWLGWSPIGPYDSSDRRTERLIGWHINTGDPARPTSFATADQYRKELYRPGLLKNLVDRGELTAALGDWEAEDAARPLPEPKTNVWVDEVGPDPRKRDGKGQVLVQSKPVTLKLRVDDFPLHKIDSLTWRLVGQGPRHAFDEPIGSEWSADLGALPWARGEVYQIRVSIKTLEVPPREHTQDIWLRYQPPPPVIVRNGDAATGKVERIVVRDKAEFEIKASVRPAAGEDVRVELSQSNPKLQKPTRWSETSEIDRTLTLQPGENLIQLTAVNKGALAGEEEHETSRLAVAVVYQPPQAKMAPRIDIDRIVVPGEQTTDLKFTPGTTLVVNEAVVRLVGKIQADAKLQEAGWKSNPAGELHAFKGFSAGKSIAEIDEALPALKPGAHTVRVQAKTDEGSPAETVITLDYRPRLPAVTLIRPDREVNLVDEGSGFPDVDLEWRIDNEQPFEAKVLVNGEERGAPTFKSAEQTLVAKVKLPRPGDNEIQLRLTNKWKVASLSESVVVHCVRPPRVAVAGPKTVTSDKALVDLDFQVTSAVPVVRSSMRADVNGRSITNVQWLDDNHVRLRQVPLSADQENEVTLWVSNADGQCRTPARVNVAYRAPRARVKPPEVEILDPRESTVTDGDVTVRGLIRSAAQLSKVELVRDGEHPFRKTIDVSRLKANAQGMIPFEEKVSLVPKANRIRVEAVNQGGASEALVAVTYLYLPVRLAIDTIRPKGGEAVHPELLADGQLFVPAMPAGRVTIQGRVLADKMDPEKLKKISQVRIYVNGFQQVPALLKPPASKDSRERSFERELLLNQVENRIEVELPDLKEEANDRREFSVVCRNPQAGQRLHYLVMGVGEKNSQELMKEALQAIGAKGDGNVQYHTPAFSEIRLYGPLTGYVRPERVFTQLCIIKQTVDLLARSGSANDVVLVYYEGQEAVTKDGHYFKTSLSRIDPVLRRSAITCAGLEAYLQETLGAKIVWLDVQRDKADQSPAGEGRDMVAKWDDAAHAAIWRAAWNEGDPSLNSSSRWLLKALDSETPNRRRLQDVATGVDSLFERLFPKALTYVRHDPEPYRGLVLGPGS